MSIQQNNGKHEIEGFGNELPSVENQFEDFCQLARSSGALSCNDMLGLPKYKLTE